ncbi:hypothetical protein NDS46_09415 [Paenibacillus thiaminolyticus]|uniref:hypothetical protein n=1 Tax=Paenibacillus thiaminolyticus TaxID=49283 RepID=UPI00232D3431|nr:hypothetical protein [Paenibacillus thiaminolyticus]WCF10047.1 hypothetical protein NDS46_09415 [Paenibacillus thiaminolyticus]
MNQSEAAMDKSESLSPAGAGFAKQDKASEAGGGIRNRASPDIRARLSNGSTRDTRERVKSRPRGQMAGQQRAKVPLRKPWCRHRLSFRRKRRKRDERLKQKVLNPIARTNSNKK